MDDNPHELTQLEYQLSSISSSCRLIATTDPVEAMMRLRKDRYDILFTSYRMSVLDGLSLVRIAHKIDSSTSVNILSNQADAIYIKSQPVYEYCDNLLLKPCDINDLKHVLKRYDYYQELSEENKKLAARLNALEKHSGLPLGHVSNG